MLLNNEEQFYIELKKFFVRRDTKMNCLENLIVSVSSLVTNCPIFFNSDAEVNSFSDPNFPSIINLLAQFRPLLDGFTIFMKKSFCDIFLHLNS